MRARAAAAHAPLCSSRVVCLVRATPRYPLCHSYTLLPDLDAELAKMVGPAAPSASVPEGCIRPQHAFFGVYDGHGGAGCSTHAAGRLHLHLNSDEQAAHHQLIPSWADPIPIPYRSHTDPIPSPSHP